MSPFVSDYVLVTLVSGTRRYFSVGVTAKVPTRPSKYLQAVAVLSQKEATRLSRVQARTLRHLLGKGWKLVRLLNRSQVKMRAMAEVYRGAASDLLAAIEARGTDAYFLKDLAILYKHQADALWPLRAQKRM